MAKPAEEPQPPFTPQPEVAKRFFDRAAEVAMTNNFDYAMELYRDGIKWDPDALDQGHKPLLEIGRKRKAGGGKGVGMMDMAHARKVKEPNEKLSWAAFFLAKEPDSTKYLESVLQNAIKVGATRTAKWSGILLVEANRDSAKPVLERFLVAIDALEAVKAYDEAVVACQIACRLKPNDQTLTTRLKNLSAEQTMQRGQYETAESFKGSLDNAKKQMDAQQNINLVNQDAVVERQLNDARRELAHNPAQAGKIFALADALCKRGRPEDVTEAAAVLDKGYTETGSYRFRERRDDITLRELHARAQASVAEAKADPTNAPLRVAAEGWVRSWRAEEERIYADRVQNYPTDLTLKFEYGRRLFTNGKYDEAIAQFQAAENDAKNRLRALSYLGQSFFRREFFQEAVDTYRRAIAQVEMSGGETAKDLHYNLGLALEHMGKPEDADAAFSKVIQWDFNYRDTRQRIQKLRQERKDKDNPTEPKEKNSPAESAG